MNCRWFSLRWSCCELKVVFTSVVMFEIQVVVTPVVMFKIQVVFTLVVML